MNDTLGIQPRFQRVIKDQGMAVGLKYLLNAPKILKIADTTPKTRTISGVKIKVNAESH